MFLAQIVNLADPQLWWLLLILLIVGVIVIAAIGFLFAFPIATLAAIAVFFFTGSLLWAGITFLIVALISAAIGDLLHMSRRHHHHEDDHHD